MLRKYWKYNTLLNNLNQEKNKYNKQYCELKHNQTCKNYKFFFFFTCILS